MVLLRNSHQRCIHVKLHAQLKNYIFIIIMALVLVTMVILSIKTLNFKLYDDYNMTWDIFNSSGALFTPPHSTQPHQKRKYYFSRTHHYFSCTNPHHNYKRVFDALNSNLHVQVGRVHVLSIFVVGILPFNQCIGISYPCTYVKI
eukprot:537999_1